MGSAVEGEVEPGFEGVRAAFEANLEEGLEIGAAFSAYHRGRKVVDLWGGVADPTTGAPWQQDTIVLVFSSTKGAVAVCANRLAEQGLLDPEAPVADVWPEFAQAGKQDITVSQVLSHQAGLAWCDGQMSTAEALAWDPVIEALQAQAPSWVPGEAHGYHVTTWGWLVGELIRRASGVRVGAYLRSEVCDPLGLDLWIGLPEDQEPRVARLSHFLPDKADAQSLLSPGDDPTMQLLSQFMGPETNLGRAVFAPGYALASASVWESRELRAAEIPAANGVTDARSLARMYAACIGEVDGVRLLGEEQVARAATQRTSGPDEVILGLDLQFGLGFMVPSSILALGGPGSFGHFGMGGSVGWADPELELATGYVMNRMDLGLAGDLRSARLVKASRACIEGLST